MTAQINAYATENVSFVKKHLNEIIQKLQVGNKLYITVSGKIVASIEKIEQKGILS